MMSLTPGLEHDRGGVRVGEDVELRRRRDVALADGAAHQHDLAMWATMSGARWIALAMLVSGPIGQSVTAPGRARTRSMITSTA